MNSDLISYSAAVTSSSVATPSSSSSSSSVLFMRSNWRRRSWMRMHLGQIIFLRVRQTRWKMELHWSHLMQPSSKGKITSLLLQISQMYAWARHMGQDRMWSLNALKTPCRNSLSAPDSTWLRSLREYNSFDWARCRRTPSCWSTSFNSLAILQAAR